VDSDFGPFFLKFSTYFPYTAKLCVNGNEWAKRQAAKAGIGFEALDNGFAAVEDVEALQRICDSFGPEHIEALLRKWLAILPNPFTPADEDAGYRYELSILQAEFSLTQMLDRPVSGRIFFERVLHDNLDIGRPGQIGLVFDRRIITKGRRVTPGRFRTRVITEGVTPSLHVDYKNAKIKQYHKEGRALLLLRFASDASFDQWTGVLCVLGHLLAGGGDVGVSFPVCACVRCLNLSLDAMGRVVCRGRDGVLTCRWCGGLRSRRRLGCSRRCLMAGGPSS
jgi:hypothetical protein